MTPSQLGQALRERFEAFAERVALGEAQPTPLHIEKVSCDARVAFDSGPMTALVAIANLLA